MPIYEFHCAGCQRDSEVLTRSTDWKGTRCPHCGSRRLSKKISVFASGAGGGDEAPACGMNSGGCCGGSCGCGSGHGHRH